MLTLEIALFAGTAGVLIALLSCLLMLNTRRQMNRRLDAFKLELDVHLSANYEMAKHLRALQSHGNTYAANAETHDGPNANDDAEPNDARRYEPPELEAALSRRAPGQQETGLSLAEKLGLSQSEADIVTHLRPRKRGVRETA